MFILLLIPGKKLYTFHCFISLNELVFNTLGDGDNIEGTLSASMGSQSKRMTDIPRPVLRDIDHHPETFYVGLHPRSANRTSGSEVGERNENSPRHAAFYSKHGGHNDCQLDFLFQDNSGKAG